MRFFPCAEADDGVMRAAGGPGKFGEGRKKGGWGWREKINRGLDEKVGR